ncbi:type I secretion system permease/ATPase [Hyphomicrobium sp. DY-1]|uniref:type I secretion system permease/ATPase n=1 Tax=Hyphomicrobium sp. DY-1 TaxID=3075650 RepID=UPI0039C39736
MTSPSERATPLCAPMDACVGFAATNLTPALVGVAVFGCVTNILALTGSMFMLQIYDRVIPSHSVPTLVAFLLLALGLYTIFGILDVIRSRLMTRIAAKVDAILSKRVFALILESPLKGQAGADALKPSQELDQIRTFLSGSGPLALFDLPWMPIYLVICFLFHPLIGGLTTAAMLILIALAALTDVKTRGLTKAAAQAASNRNILGEATHRGAESVTALGMTPVMLARWSKAHAEFISKQRQAADIGGSLSGVSKAVRYSLQSGALGLGAYLTINNEISSGMIVASSIVVARAVAPIEQVIAQWRSLVAARQAWQSLHLKFTSLATRVIATAPPLPGKSLAIEGIFVSPPGQTRATVQNVSFRANAGAVIGVLGASASGKSSLVRAIVGVWQPGRGHVRLDGASLDQWSEEELGRFIGYVPQSVDLFEGTIADNISRLDPVRDNPAVIAAAEAAGVHGMIVRLPGGYDFHVGPGGVNLSAGQRQRIALARALYKDPFLVVMDEPNSNLDTEGDQALAAAIAGIRQRGGITIIVAHRRSVLSVLDHVLFMEDGFAKAFGPRDVVLKSLEQRNARAVRAPQTAALAVVAGDAV